jgi:hypothetical protein
MQFARSFAQGDIWRRTLNGFQRDTSPGSSSFVGQQRSESRHRFFASIDGQSFAGDSLLIRRRIGLENVDKRSLLLLAGSRGVSAADAWRKGKADGETSA